MSNVFLIAENPFFKHDIDKLCLICTHQFKMDQTSHSILDRLEQSQPEPWMNVYDALESISNFKEIKLQKQTEKVCEFCFKNIARVIRFCEMCNKSASFLKSYIQYNDMNNISQSGTINPVTHDDSPMLNELTCANVLSIKPELLNDHEEQDMKMQVWPEFARITTLDTLISTTETTMLENEEIANMETLAKVVCTKPKVNDVAEQNVKMELWPELGTIITGDTLNCTATILGKEETIIQQKKIMNIETCVEELCTIEKISNDKMEPDVKMEVWPELPTITTSDTLNYTAAMLVKEEAIIQKISNLPEKGITNIETCLERPTTTATLINADKEIGIERVKTGAKKSTSDGPNECNVCGKKFLTSQYLTAHLKRVHSDEKPFACEKCEECFSTRKRFKEHMIIHLEVKRHECKVCGRKFPYPSKLKEHLIVHSDEQPFVCDKCGKCLPSRRSFRRHMNGHLEVKGHECNVCGKILLRSSYLKAHLSVHSDVRPFVCEKCGKCFSTTKRLKDHMISHLEVKGYECKICGKKFLRSSVLKLHLSLHSDEKPFKCEKCGKFFSGKQHLKQHMISHSELKKHECHLCGNRFKHAHSLRKHLSNHCNGTS